MIETVVFHEMAGRELAETAEYYESRVDGLGEAFITEVERVTNFIGENPNASPIVLKTIRKKILWRFPYSILYSVTGNTVRILAIANHKRRPFYWRNRR